VRPIKFLRLVVAVLGLEMLIGQMTLGLEVGGYLDNRFQVNDDEQVSISNKAKIEIKEKADNYYMLVAMQGFYETREQEAANEAKEAETVNEFKLSRAYIDLYRKWGKTTLGLQNLAWGSGYYFNLPDLFNVPDPVDPKGEKDGINALEAKWNINATTFGEVVFLPDNDLAESDYGIRVKSNLGLFDLILNNVKKQAPNELVRKRQSAIMECRGEIGEDYPGLWVQTAYNNDTMTDGAEADYFSCVGGMDYTFRLGNGVYIVGEYCRNGIVEHSEQLFFSTQYDFNSSLSGRLNYLHDLTNGGDLYSLNIKYYIFDKVELSNTLNYYPDGSAKIGLINNDIKIEYVLGIKLTF
jgi:hypothetical protein